MGKSQLAVFIEKIDLLRFVTTREALGQGGPMLLLQEDGHLIRRLGCVAAPVLVILVCL